LNRFQGINAVDKGKKMIESSGFSKAHETTLGSPLMIKENRPSTFQRQSAELQLQLRNPAWFAIVSGRLAVDNSLSVVETSRTSRNVSDHRLVECLLVIQSYPSNVWRVVKGYAQLSERQKISQQLNKTSQHLASQQYQHLRYTSAPIQP
jgi:hypothetical protein